MKKIYKILLTSTSAITLPLSVLPLVSCQNVPGSISNIMGPNELEVNQTAMYVAPILPEAADQSIIWSVDNENVASIDEHGTLYALKEGTVTITATSKVNESLVSTKAVTIVPMTTQEIEIVGPESIVLYSKESHNIKYQAKILPEGVTDSVYWKVEEGGAATIDRETGQLTPKFVGYALITATSVSKPDVHSSLIVHITEPVAEDWNTDEWGTLCYFANQGLDVLKEQYSEEWERESTSDGKVANSFIGSRKQLVYQTAQGDTPFNLRVIGQEHDLLAGGSKSDFAALTFQSVELLPTNPSAVVEVVQWNPPKWYDSYNNSWYVQEDWDSYIRNYMRTTIFEKITKSLGFDIENSPIKTIKKTTCLGNKTDQLVDSTENVFILGLSDIFSYTAITNSIWEDADKTGTLADKSSIYLSEGSQYEFYQQAIGDLYPEGAAGNQWLVKKNSSSSYSFSYWIRSPFLRDDPENKDLNLESFVISNNGELTPIDLQKEGSVPTNALSVCFCI